MSKHSILASICMTLAAIAGCAKDASPVRPEPDEAKPTAPRPSDAMALTGSGSTFVYPLMSKWVEEYDRVAGVGIAYKSIGSGAGIDQIIARRVDFGVSDVAMNDDELARASGPIVHVPIALGAVVLAYNVPGVPPGLKLSRAAIAGVFLGTVGKWNDRLIASQNPGIALPDTEILVAYRSDSSGTTAVFTRYLSAISATWKARVGDGKKMKFPVGTSAKGNEGVTSLVKNTPGAIGYIEHAYAIRSGLAHAAVENGAGTYVDPSFWTISAAAASMAARLPSDMRVSIVNADGNDAYPIASFSFALVHERPSDAVKGRGLVTFLWWATHEGQHFAGPLAYVPLPAQMVVAIEAKLRALKGEDTASTSN